VRLQRVVNCCVNHFLTGEHVIKSNLSRWEMSWCEIVWGGVVTNKQTKLPGSLLREGSWRLGYSKYKSAKKKEEV